jgi:murein DD-endopeptidase MepM/ murein hydrolase activator NlpD
MWLLVKKFISLMLLKKKFPISSLAKTTILTTLFIILLQTSSCIFEQDIPGEENITVSDTSCQKKVPEPVRVYGIPVDSFTIVPGHIKRNGFLSGILLEHGISMNEIDIVVNNSRDVFDVRKIRSNNNYTLFLEKDSLEKAAYLVYEHEPTVFYIFSFNDSLNITAFREETRSVIRYSSGVIETSLWDAMIKGGLHPSLVIELSKIFAWSVDFFGLQKGDRFKVIYDEKFIKDKSIGIDRVYAAQFEQSGLVTYAIPFIQNGMESFYNVDGNSLRKAFLKSPLEFARITSRFSSHRMHPILRIVRPHFGVDYAAPVGTPVNAIGDGKVISATNENGSGKMVRIRHNSVYSTAYLHLSRFGPGITPGAMVKQGDVIGFVGSSGLSTGPHLDFRFYMNGSPVDPLKVEAPSVEPVLEENIAKFEKIKSVTLSLLATFD